MILFAAIFAISAAAPESIPLETSPKEEPVVAEESAQAIDPIPQELIDEARKVGELTGVAEACGLEWQPHYAAYLEAKTKEGVTELDRVFLAAYHGAAQGTAYEAVSKECSEEQLGDIREALDKNIKQFKK